jgi:hypothetical protein
MTPYEQGYYITMKTAGLRGFTDAASAGLNRLPGLAEDAAWKMNQASWRAQDKATQFVGDVGDHVSEGVNSAYNRGRNAWESTADRSRAMAEMASAQRRADLPLDDYAQGPWEGSRQYRQEALDELAYAKDVRMPNIERAINDRNMIAGTATLGGLGALGAYGYNSSKTSAFADRMQSLGEGVRDIADRGRNVARLPTDMLQRKYLKDIEAITPHTRVLNDRIYNSMADAQMLGTGAALGVAGTGLAGAAGYGGATAVDAYNRRNDWF